MNNVNNKKSWHEMALEEDNFIRRMNSSDKSTQCSIIGSSIVYSENNFKKVCVVCKQSLQIKKFINKFGKEFDRCKKCWSSR